MIDLVQREKETRAYQSALARLARHLRAWPVSIAAFTIVYAAYVAFGLRSAAPVDGVLRGEPLSHPVRIYRDARGIPHIRAQDEYGEYFAQGFVQGSDRLFQMDLIRRYAYGELSEMLGPIQLSTDEELRAYDVRGIVARQWVHLTSRERYELRAFSDGVNAAARAQPLPIEFRLLLYRPRAWSPRDSLAAVMAIALSVSDTADNVLARDGFWRAGSAAHFAHLLPLSDPRYDVSADGKPQGKRVRESVAWSTVRAPVLPAAGSNAWAAGASHNSAGRALIANDPHLNASIPGIWYALEVRGPDLHAAGVTIPGVPGIVLGHNERIAWAATNAMASTISLFDAVANSHVAWKREIFHVRFAPDAAKSYYRTARDFAVRENGDRVVLERWVPYSDPRTAITTILALDRAQNISQALRVLRDYAGPPQNFVLAGADGRIAYHLAGVIPDDPAWGRYIHPQSDLRQRFAPVPFDRLPQTVPSRTAVVVSANNKMYGPAYPFRLSPMFAPPYRAFRIAELLHARRFYDTAYFAEMQLDTISPADADFAHRAAEYARAHEGLLTADQIEQLAAWNGSFAPGSTAATLERKMRDAIEGAAPSPYAPFEALRSAPLPDQVTYALDASADPPQSEPWRIAGAVHVLHPFGPIGFPFLNAKPLPGDGDRYTVRVQTADMTQSFRAVWRPGDWDAGGLSLPSGESGEFGSPHYDDLRSVWIRGMLQPMPFSDAAVLRSSHHLLTLRK